MKLGAALGRDVAHKLVEQAVIRANSEGRTLTEALAATPEITKAMTPNELRDLSDPRGYLGAAEVFRKQLLASED